MKTFEVKLIAEDVIYVYIAETGTPTQAIRKALTVLPTSDLRNDFREIRVNNLTKKPSQA